MSRIERITNSDITQQLRQTTTSARVKSHGKIFIYAMPPNEKGQRREPAAGGVEFVSERIGWLPFAAPT